MAQSDGNFDCHLTRREFALLTAGGLAALGLSAGREQRAMGAPLTASSMLRYDADVAVVLRGVPSGSAEEATALAVRSAALSATDFRWLRRGDTVLIKPACNSGNSYPATTDPIALRAMITLLREHGAGRVMVADMSGVEFVRFYKDGLRGSTRALMRRNNMAQVVEAAGAEVYAFEEHGWDAFFEDHPLATGTWKGPIMMPNILREVDHIVLMPRCARHLLAGSTLGMKAGVGWWRHDSRLEYHHDAATLPEKTADACTVRSLTEKQRLVLTSATRILTTFGPDKGYVAMPPTGLIIASPSLVAHDMVSLAWLLENRLTTPVGERDGAMNDPNTSALFVNLANRMVTDWLGGIGRAITAERLTRNDLNSVWDDRVLRRAFLISGGVPRIEFVTDNSVPGQLVDRLRTKVALPLVAS